MEQQNPFQNMGKTVVALAKKSFSDLKQLKEGAIVQFVLMACVIVIGTAFAFQYYYSTLNTREAKAMTAMYQKKNSFLAPVNYTNPMYQYSLKDYFIKTAYNSCSGGSYQNDFVNIDNLKNVIKQGARCLDFEIHNIGDQPVVATSTIADNTYVKTTFNSVPNTDVMYTIVNYAFSGTTAPNPSDPILIHLRPKSIVPTMYSNLAVILAKYNLYLLSSHYSYEASYGTS